MEIRQKITGSLLYILYSMTKSRRGFSVSAHLSSPHRSPVYSTSRCQQVSCHINGRLPSLHRHQRSPRRRRQATSGRFPSRRFCRELLNGSSSVRISTRHYSSHTQRLISETNSRSDRPARRRLLSWRYYTLSAQC